MLLLFGHTLASPPIAKASPQYNFTKIDVPRSSVVGTLAQGIDDAGKIVGSYDTEGTGRQGFLLKNENFSDINFPGTLSTDVTSISPNGKIIVGNYLASDGVHDSVQHAFILNRGTFSTITPPGATYTSGRGVNSHGVVAGFFENNTGRFSGFLYDKGVFTTLEFPGASSTFIWGINNAGQLIGTYSISGQSHGFLFQNGHFRTLALPGFVYTVPLGINASGQIVGYVVESETPFVTHGFILSNGVVTLIDVPFPGATRTSIMGINAEGQIVGLYIPLNGTTWHSFLATPTHKHSDIMKFPFGRL